MKNDALAIPGDKIWNDYRGRLRRFILSRINNPVAAEDIVQEVLLKAYENLGRLEDQQKIFSWIFQITRNAIVDYYRKRKTTEALDDTLVMQELEEHNDTEKELADCMIPLLERLPAHYREAVMLSEINGLTQKEIALTQGLSLSGAKSRVQRGREMLKEVLLECCQIERGQRGSIVDYEPNEKCDNCK